jgi:hypothetical protein
MQEISQRLEAMDGGRQDLSPKAKTFTQRRQDEKATPMSQRKS